MEDQLKVDEKEFSGKVSKALDMIFDSKFYLESFCRLKTKSSSGLEPFILNRLQLYLFNMMELYDRILLVKSRQLGSSTGVVGKIFHHAIFTPGVTSAIIAHTAKAATELLDKIKTFHRTIPPEIRPEFGMNSKFEITFPKTESKILVLPATEELGRSYSFNGIVLASELPFWPKPEEQMAALLPSIHGKLIVESSPNMVGDAFHKLWVSDNDFFKISAGWWWGYTREEIDKIRREMNDDAKFFREYCCMFMSSGSAVFDLETTDLQRKNVRRIGDKMKSSEGHEWTVQKIDGIPVDGKAASADGLVVFRPPSADGIYILGSDVAAGYKEGDYSAATVLDRRTGEQVAFWRGHVSPYRFAEMLFAWGRYYNSALMIPEINNHGLSVLDRLKQLCYGNLYYRPKGMETPGERISDRLGWKTGPSTRDFLINDFKTAVKSSILTVRSKETFDELTTFVYDRYGRPDHLDGFHDDSLMSMAIAYQGYKMCVTEDPGQLDLHEVFGRGGY